MKYSLMKKRSNKVEAIVFDLDNTLYDSKQYFVGSFKEIAHYVSKKHKVSYRKSYHLLTSIWKNKSSMYSFLFDDFLEQLKLYENPKKLVKIFNSYSGKIKPFSDTIPTIKKLKGKGYKMGLITDGNISRQKRKIKKLELEDCFDCIIFTKKLKPKPSVKPYFILLQRLKLKPSEVVYVGDNPNLDFSGAKKVGLKTVRVARGEFSKIPDTNNIDCSIDRLKELLRFLL